MKNLDKICKKIYEFAKNRKTIKNDNEAQILASLINEILEYLPGPLTIQKIDRIDDTFWQNFDNFAETKFAQIVQKIVSILDINITKTEFWFEIEQIFQIESLNFFNESIQVILDEFKNNPKNRDFLVILLENCLKSNSLFASIMSGSLSLDNDLEKESVFFDQKWRHFIQNLISIPNRVSNHFGNKSPEFFQLDNYLKTLLFNCLTVIDIVILLNLKPEQNFVYLLDKILLNFNQNRVLIENFLLILTKWSLDNLKFRKKFQQILAYFDRNSIEICTTILVKIPNYPTVKIFENIVLKSENWYYILFEKIPFSSNNIVNSKILIENLVKYLKNFQQHFEKFFLKILTIWSKKSFINHENELRQIFLTKLLIRCSKNCLNYLTDHSSILYAGVSKHLESCNDFVKILGMVVGELFSEQKLQFDYNNYNNDIKQLVSELKDFYYQIDDNDSGSFFDINEDQLLSNFCQKVVITAHSNTSSNNDVIKTDLRDETLKKVSQINICETVIDSDDDDDDLKPYDMSNDKKSVKKPPAYLRDLVEGLLDSDNLEYFTICLENCEELIRKQLSEDDISLSVNLLEILLFLEPKSVGSIDNFETIILNSCVSIAVIHPKSSAIFLCKVFHTEDRIYSLSQKMLVLKIIQETVKNFDQNGNYFLNLGYFYFPLLYGCCDKGIFLKFMQNDCFDVMLLQNYLKTLGLIFEKSSNSPLVLKMFREMFLIVWNLRFHPIIEAKMAFVEFLCVALYFVPANLLNSEANNELEQIFEWTKIRLNDPDSDRNLDSRVRNLFAVLQKVIDQ